MKPKFKAGDKVRILDGSNIVHYTGGWAPWNMRKHVGRVVTIKCVDKDFKDSVGYEVREVDFVWDERGLELVKELKENPTIVKVIYDNNDTIVYWSDDTKTKVTCQTGDHYDKEKGLAMAIAKKYLGNGHDYYETFKKHLDDVTFRFLAVKNDPYYFTKGKVYEAINGRVTYDDGETGAKYNSFDEYRRCNLSLARCIVELKEDDDPKEIMKQYEKPKRYSGRVVCIETTYGTLTVGKIYEVKDSILTFDNGHKSTPIGGENFNEWATYWESKFIEIKEDK